MLSEEQQVFDESVDPYDSSIDRDFDDGIAERASFGAFSDELEEIDEANWDSDWDDETVPQAEQTDETADYDDLFDD